MLNNKIFIIGLPRTGTTSICSKFIELGYTVAHTAYTQKTFEQAQVIADTPIFSDYQQLDLYYPNSQFIYLERELTLWLPSIKQLLQRMHHNITRNDGGFNPYIKRCYQKVFSPFTLENINDDEFLSNCYLKHRDNVRQYFIMRKSDWLMLDISKKESLDQLQTFLGVEKTNGSFDKLNIGGKVTAWKDINNTLKIESTQNGRISTLDYLNQI
ncbi:sulfotransferase [Colwelliaceae bacterium 6441]